ncbi:MAG: NUDIX hydrolase [Gemmatimonadota bacterium]|nr:NUDIX hydrolase [Gemmatimonadota bacterium]
MNRSVAPLCDATTVGRDPVRRDYIPAMTLLASRRVHTGRTLNLDLDQVRFPNGTEGSLEMVRHPGAAAIVPFLDPPGDPDPRVLLIRQFRHAADGWLWEVPAGTRDGQEPMDRCAARELEEETGCTAARLELLAAIYTTPGFTNEVIHLYLATGLTRGRVAHEADEFMEVHEVRWSEVGRRIRASEIRDAKTLATLMYVQCFRRPGPPA